MYTYTLKSERNVTDYYGIDQNSYPGVGRSFSDASIWVARQHLILYLIKEQERSMAHDYYDISIFLSANEEDEAVFLGAWTLRKLYPHKWNWKAEAKFLKKHNLYRAGDKELLAIEQAYHQCSKDEDFEPIIADLKMRLSKFEEKYGDAIQDYAPELGILYYFLRDGFKAFEFLTLRPMFELQDLTYSIAQALGYEYLRKYDALYQEHPARW